MRGWSLPLDVAENTRGYTCCEPYLAFLGTKKYQLKRFLILFEWNLKWKWMWLHMGWKEKLGKEEKNAWKRWVRTKSCEKTARPKNRHNIGDELIKQRYKFKPTIPEKKLFKCYKSIQGTWCNKMKFGFYLHAMQLMRIRQKNEKLKQEIEGQLLREKMRKRKNLKYVTEFGHKMIM